MTGTTVSHYRILEKLGSGGMGVVYRAQDTKLGRFVALKFLPEHLVKDRQALERFQHEARAASALNHPNICTIYDIDEHEGQPFIAMELIEGQTVRELIGESPPPVKIAQLGGQVARALVVAHAAGIIHRDIKPENLKVRGDGYVKVLDFGLARLVSTLAQSAEETAAGLGFKTVPGTLLGTARYMSPEQASGETASSAADIFSLGIVLYEVATGRHPFAADSQVAVLHAILSQAPFPISHANPIIPSSLEVLISAMLEKEAPRRPSAAEVEHALAELAGGATETCVVRVAPPPPQHTVGREKEHTDLRAAYESVATSGQGIMVCIAGEPGIGKTTVIEDFLNELRDPCIIARGRCSERLAGTEAYLPILDVLEDVSRADSAGARLMKLVAPSWYAQIAPLVLNGSSGTSVPPKFEAASQERLKREFVSLLQAVCRERPLILFLDDVHWADVSTVDLLAYVGSKLTRLRLLILATYRQSELLLGKHPFLKTRLELQTHGLCRELSLRFLTRADIENYLALEFPNHRFPAAFLALIQSKTEGNPLFMVDLLRYLRARNIIVEQQDHWGLTQEIPAIEHQLPESVRSMIDRKIDQLDENDRRLLTAASVQGNEFESAVVARALGKNVEDVEERLERLDRVHAFVRMVGEDDFPDGTPTLRYRFVHVFYQNELYGSLAPSRRVSLGKAVAEALSGYYAGQTEAVASKLGFLLETARDYLRAAHYFWVAAEHASGIFAYNESISLAGRGLKLLEKLPDTPDRNQKELQLQLTLGIALMITRGYAAPEAGRTFTRARALSQNVGDIPQRFSALYGLCVYYVLRTELPSARQIGKELLQIARSSSDPTLLLGAHNVAGLVLSWGGELRAGHAHLEQGIALWDRRQLQSYLSLYKTDPGAHCRSHSTRELWMLGYPDQARRRVEQTLLLEREDAHPQSLATALYHAALFHVCTREPQRVQALAEECVKLCNEHGFVLERAWVTSTLGWALAKQGKFDEGIAQIRAALEAERATGCVLGYTIFSPLLVGALMEAGHTEEALAEAVEAWSFVVRSGVVYWNSELCRLKGELLLMKGEGLEGEACFREAIGIAQRQEAKSLELRAAMSLARLLQAKGERLEAQEILGAVYGWFTEGFDTADLEEARALLKGLS